MILPLKIRHWIRSRLKREIPGVPEVVILPRKELDQNDGIAFAEAGVRSSHH
jgi:hypothetical protein